MVQCCVASESLITQKEAPYCMYQVIEDHVSLANAVFYLVGFIAKVCRKKVATSNYYDFCEGINIVF